jgi:hypothetical protein
MKRILFSVTLLATFLSNPASADLVVGQTYNSGYSNGVALAPGAADPDFTLYSTVPGQSPVESLPVVANPVPAVWVMSSGAQFISPTEDQAYPSLPPEGDAPGVYDYQAILTTDFSAATQLTITGAFGADNAATAYIDGFDVQEDPAPGYAALVDFSYMLTVPVGVQQTTADFVVNNQNDTEGPVNPTGVIVSGLRASEDDTAAAPEPREWMMLSLGLSTVLLMQRLRRLSLS